MSGFGTEAGDRSSRPRCCSQPRPRLTMPRSSLAPSFSRFRFWRWRSSTVRKESAPRRRRWLFARSRLRLWWARPSPWFSFRFGSALIRYPVTQTPIPHASRANYILSPQWGLNYFRGPVWRVGPGAALHFSSRFHGRPAAPVAAWILGGIHGWPRGNHTRGPSAAGARV